LPKPALSIERAGFFSWNERAVNQPMFLRKKNNKMSFFCNSLISLSIQRL